MEKTLNPKQLEAINHENGSLLIIAGAGTGKTTVITERIRHLIVDKETPPSSVLALTFTEKAAYEMQERVDVLLPYGYTNLWIHTFHSFCDRILKDEAHTIGLDPNYRLMTESEAVLLMRQNIFELGLKIFRPLGSPTKFLDALLTHFSRLKDEDITPEQYLKFAQSPQKIGSSKEKTIDETSKRSDLVENDLEQDQYLELAHAYQEYETLKIKNSVMDFSDLISNTLRLFRERPNILKRYQRQFKFVLVDEFQDTNFAQNELAILLSEDDKNITVVGDPNQAIYRFRGAAISNILQFEKSFPDVKIVNLTDNYRSTQVILDGAYNLIQNNNLHTSEIFKKINEKLKSHSKGKFPIELIHEKRAEDEADAIARKIHELRSKNHELRDIAILVRANNHAQLITTALARHKIPYQFLGPGYLFQQEEVKDLIAYLMFLTNLADSVSLFRVLSMDIFEIPYIELNFLLNFAKKKNMTLFEAMENVSQTSLKPETQEKILKIRAMIERHLERSKKENAGQVLYYFLVDSGLFETLNITESVKEERRVQNIAKFFDRIKNFETERPDSTIFTIVEWLNLMLSMGDSPTAADIDMKDRDAVSILTVHGSKGLEFKVVFLVNLVNDRFPSRERTEKIPLPEGIIKETIIDGEDFHTQEERRLFYVGMTRAKERLFFTAADFYGTGKRAKKLSPFIHEALPDLLQKQEKAEKIQQLSLTEVLSVYQPSEEKVETKEKFKVSYITFSNLQSFDICPLHYKAQVIFKIPTPLSAALSFGISMHNALYEFYKRAKDAKLSVDDLKDLLRQEWIPDGYVNKKHEEERFQLGLKSLEKFYRTEPPHTPIGLELPFSFTLKNGVKVFGKIDRIDTTPTGIEIVDYKTGEDNPKAEKAHKLQLAIYALAATRVKDNALNRKPEEIKLTLHFLEGNTKKSMEFKQEDLDRLEDELVETIKEIEKSDFKCSKNMLCINCEFKLLCNTN